MGDFIFTEYLIGGAALLGSFINSIAGVIIFIGVVFLITNEFSDFLNDTPLYAVEAAAANFLKNFVR
jgi:hypothetical protein